MMANKGLGSPSHCGGPDRLLMSPSGHQRSLATTPRNKLDYHVEAGRRRGGQAGPFVRIE